ncbi:MAG: hypothetical protein V1897_02025 [Pseudomonadota bacterium]
MTYSHFQHRHNFAVWCAARAVQRGFVKSPVLKDALEKSGVVEFIKNNEGRSLSQDNFDKRHETWCESILQTWEKDKIKGASYGRAAKLLAVYIKSMIVVQNDQNKLSDVAHPPIDRIILRISPKMRTSSTQIGQAGRKSIGQSLPDRNTKD